MILCPGDLWTTRFATPVEVVDIEDDALKGRFFPALQLLIIQIA